MSWPKVRPTKIPAMMKAMYSTLAILAFFIASLHAQVPVTLSPVANQQFFSASGTPLAAGCLFTYQAGTSTPLATYTDATGLYQQTNPIILDGGGFASIWLQSAAYRFVLFSNGGTNCATGTQQWVIDNVNPSPFLGGNNIWTGTNTFSGTVNVNGAFNATAGGSLNGTFSGDPNFSGSPTFSGVVAASQFQSTIGTGTPPFISASTTVVPNFNVENINGVAYPASPSDHSVPVVTSSTAHYKVVPDCQSAAGFLNFTQSTDTWGCGTGGTVGLDCQDVNGNHLNYTLSSTTFTCGTSIKPNLITSVSNCASSASCSGISIMAGPHVIMGGPVITDGGTPGLRTITGMSPAFTSSTSYFCSLTIVGNSGISQAPEIMYVSGSSFQIYSNDGTMVTVDYICLGN